MYGNNIMKRSLIAGNPLEAYRLQHKDEICLGVNVRKLERNNLVNLWLNPTDYLQMVISS